MTMDNSAEAPLPSSDSPGFPRAEHNGDASHYDDGDELLLLQLADMNNDPVPANLEASTSQDRDSNHASSKEIAVPVLMERPQSSGIDVTAFQFSKPVQRGKNFSLRPGQKQPAGHLESRENPLSQQDQPRVRQSDDCDDPGNAE